ADPGPNYRRAAGEQDQLGEVPQAGILADDGGGNTNTFGYVVQGKAQNQKSAQRRLTLSESSPNRQPFAQIVQPDPQRNPIGNAQRRDLTILANGAYSQQCAQRNQSDEEYQRHTLPEGWQLGGKFLSIQPGSHRQKNEQPDGQGQDEVHGRTTQAAHERIPQHPQQHRHDAHIQANQPELDKQLPGRLRTFDRYANFTGKCRAE